jgi:hypothetical protein
MEPRSWTVTFELTQGQFTSMVIDALFCLVDEDDGSLTLYREPADDYEPSGEEESEFEPIAKFADGRWVACALTEIFEAAANKKVEK